MVCRYGFDRQTDRQTLAERMLGVVQGGNAMPSRLDGPRARIDRSKAIIDGFNREVLDFFHAHPHRVFSNGLLRRKMKASSSWNHQTSFQVTGL